MLLKICFLAECLLFWRKSVILRLANCILLQSSDLCVKCLLNGELSGERKVKACGISLASRCYDKT